MGHTTIRWKMRNCSNAQFVVNAATSGRKSRAVVAEVSHLETQAFFVTLSLQLHIVPLWHYVPMTMCIFVPFLPAVVTHDGVPSSFVHRSKISATGVLC